MIAASFLSDLANAWENHHDTFWPQTFVFLSLTMRGLGLALLAGLPTGILLSRLSGLVRQRVFSHYFGLRNDAADAFTAALRIPNLLQNLFGEGALSGSFASCFPASACSSCRPGAWAC